jgi:phosphomannomutase/phosphoglucomutase
VVDSAGNVIWPDRVLMLLALEVLSASPGADIVYDVKSSRHLAEQIRAHGGRPVMCPSGHSLLKAKVRETGAPLGGELSGHIVFGDRWYGFDDAMYAAARLLELLTMDELSSAEVFANQPVSPTTPELMLPMAEGEAQALMQRLLADPELPGAELITIDGLRAEFPDGWGLVRASNTTPALAFRFEAETDARLEQIQRLFREALIRLRPDLRPPF